MTDDLSLGVEDLSKLRRSGTPHRIVDVREPWELEICAFDGSLNVPLEALPAHVDALPEDELLVVVCHYGMRSLHAVEWLRAYGFENAVNLDGGIDAWAREIDPSMAVY